MNYKDAVSVVEESGAKAFLVGTAAGELRKRLFVNGLRLAEYKPRSTRRGFMLYEHDVASWDFVRPAPTKEPSVEWERTLRRAHKMLKASGFWPDVRESIEAALEIGYAKVTQAYDIEWRDLPEDKELTYEKREAKKNERIKAVDPRLLSTTIRWHLRSPLKIKAMYFGRWQNVERKAEVKKIVESGKEGSVYARGETTGGYDVTFSFKPASGDQPAKAWWSEEFRGCGNGHYYLALNAEHAVFWEND